jgi:hypothetical protein
MTRQAFLREYRADLCARYDWAYGDERLDRFMASVERTISTKAKTWNHTGEAVTAAWRSIGGKGKPTLIALRALPSENKE